MSGSGSSSQGSVQEYVVKAPKTTKKKFNMMRFHASMGIDFKTWSNAKMERENNMKEFKSLDDEMPKYGAGSEFGREQKEEARRKKFGIHLKKYRPEDQPWLLTIGGKGGKKFKGIREGGVSENSSWYVFMQGKDGAFEAYPVEEWYNYKLVQRYKSLTAEEAEQHFERRNKIMNYFTVMKKDKNAPPDGEEETGKSKKKELILSEMDDWMSDDESDEEREEEDDSDEDMKKKRKNKVQSKGRSQRGGKKKKGMDGESDEDCIEESDEFDDGAEHDYISSDSSDSEAEDDEIARKELAGVDEADALRKLLNSDEEEEEEKEKEKEEEKDEEKKENEEKEHKDKKKKKKKKKDRKSDKEESDGKSSDASDDDGDTKKKKKKDSKSGDGSPGNPEAGSNKRKLKDGMDGDVKKQRTDLAGSSQLSTPGSDSGVTEEAIRRYLMRKPMTTTELLQKFKLKKTGLSSDQLVHSIAQILKRVNPVKQMVKGKMYLSIKM